MTKKYQTIELGDRVRDVYTGFEGTAIARTDWLYGCTRITVEPVKLSKDGVVRETVCFDEQRLQIVKKQPVLNLAPRVDSGGPQRDPQPRRAPRR